METPNPPELDEGWLHNWYAVLTGVSCAPTDDCLAVGYYRDPSESVKPLTEHWDGSEWEIVPTPLPSGAVAGQLERRFVHVGGRLHRRRLQRWWWREAAAGRALGRRFLGHPARTEPRWRLREPAARCLLLHHGSCTAVGFNHQAEEETTLAERWNGVESQALNTVDLGGTQPTNRLEAVSCNSPSACIAIGGHLAKFGTKFHAGPLAERWNGSTWSLQAIPDPPQAKKQASPAFPVPQPTPAPRWAATVRYPARTATRKCWASAGTERVGPSWKCQAPRNRRGGGVKPGSSPHPAPRPKRAPRSAPG